MTNLEHQDQQYYQWMNKPSTPLDIRFREAAIVFARVGAVAAERLHDILSLEDLALYSGLLGLATADRTTVFRSLDAKACWERLESIPPLCDAIRRYVRTEYGACLNRLEEINGGWKLDLYLATHADSLWKTVRDKCIV